MLNQTYLLMILDVVAAARAIQELNYIPLYGKPIRVMYSHRDPSVRRSGAGNIFIKVLLSVSLPFDVSLPARSVSDNDCCNTR